MKNDGSMLEIQTDAFDIYCDKAIECFRFIPVEHTWKNSDGRIIHGEFIQPFRPDEVIAAYQEQYEEMLAEMQDMQTALHTLGVEADG